ncbi:AsmA family protein [Pinibacter aurantiacus]|uniref:DUF748 domain-containing protein n=1 Tax=Pinibacter aurantiacus TaxID=2851599 RepID=A0A9E2S665_9BACT|nr:hypothetical protein [Pinibacter aurantiacus]MBV4356426.1 hypothetical protein [Pinibacter aurantiacus]
MRRRYKAILIGFLSLVLPIAGVLLYVKLNIRSVIKQMVREQTHGAYELDFKRLRANYSTLTFTVERGKLTSLDTSNGQSRYFVTFPKVILQLQSLGDLIWRKKLNITSIAFQKPEFNIVIQKNSKRTGFFQNAGDIYKYLSSFAEATNINNVEIKDATLLLKDETRNDFTYSIKNIDLFAKGFHPTDSTTTTKHRVFLTDAIKLDVGPQKVVLDSNKTVSFHALHLSTTTANLTMDSILYEGAQTDSTDAFKINLPSLRLKKLNFGRLYNEGILQVDSVMISQPRTQLTVNLSPKANKAKDVKHIMHDVVSHLFGDIDVHYLEMTNANTHLVTRFLHQERNIDIEKHTLQVNDIYITAGDSGTINLGDFTFSVKEYESFSPHNKYRMQFNQFSIKNGGDIVLKNLLVYPTSTATKPLLALPQLTIDEADIGMLLVEKKIKAKKFVLESAVIKHELKDLKEGESAKSLGAILRGITLNADIRELEFNNGTYSVVRYGAKPLKFSADSLHLYFKFKNNRLRLQSSSDLLDALQNISAKDLQFENSSYNLQAAAMEYKEDKILRLNNFNFRRSENRHFEGKSLIIDHPDIAVILDDNKFIAKSVEIDDADITHEGRNQNQPAAARRANLDVDIDNFVLNNIHLSSFERGDVKISGNNISAVLQNVHKTHGEPVTFSLKEAHTGDVNFSDNYITAKTSKISIVVGSLSTIEDFSLHRIQNGDTLLINSQRLYFQPSQFDIATRQIALDHLYADTAKVYAVFANTEKTPKNATKGKWLFNLQRSRLINVDLTVKRNNMEFISPSSDIGLETFNSTEKNIIARLGCKDYAFRFHQDTTLANVTGKTLRTSFKLTGDDGERAMNIKSFAITNTDVQFQEGSKHNLVAENVNMDAHNLQWPMSEKPPVAEWISPDHASFVAVKHIAFPTATTNFVIDSINYSGVENKLNIGSFSFAPRLATKEYLDSVKFQTDYITGKFTNISVSKPYINLQTGRRNFSANHLGINGFDISVYRDKIYPANNLYKALPATLMKRSRLSVDIDTISFSKGNIDYTEVSEKTKKGGTVTFNDVNGIAFPFRLKDTHPNDTFRVNVSALFMNKSRLALQYAAPLYSRNDAFIANVQMGAFNLKDLNPLLVPLASAVVRSGEVDKLEYSIRGDNFSGKGKMDFYYHSLIIELLNETKKNNSSFSSRLKSFAANTVVKNKNDNRTGNIYFERINSKFIFNYLFKLAFSGVMTSTGAKSNKALRKQEKKAKQKSVLVDNQLTDN